MEGCYCSVRELLFCVARSLHLPTRLISGAVKHTINRTKLPLILAGPCAVKLLGVDWLRLWWRNLVST